MGATYSILSLEERLQELSERSHTDVRAHEDAVEEHETELEEQDALIAGRARSALE